MTDGGNFFCEPIKNYVRKYDNINKFLLVKKMVTKMAFYLILHISKKTKR